MNSNKKYQWDLEDLLNGNTYEDLEKKYLASLSKLTKLYSENPFKDLDSFKKFNKASKENRLIQNRIFNYVSNSMNADLSDTKFLSIQQGLTFKITPFFTQLSNMSNDIIKNKTKILEFLKDKSLADLKYSYESVFRDEPHNLSEEIEKYLSNFAPLAGSYGHLFSTIIDQEIKVDDAIDSKNKKFKINNRADLSKYLKSSDRELRQSAWTNWTKAINNYRETFAKLLYYFYLDSNISSQTRKHGGYVEAVAFNDEIQTNFIQHVYQEVKKYAPSYENFRKISDAILKSKYRLDKVQAWDRNISVADNNEKFTIEQAQKLALEGLAVLGDDYVKQVQKSFDENWIDWLPRANKRGGAYCIGSSKGLNKVYMLLNYNNKLDDVSTLVHEMGHAMHAVQYNKYQDEYAGNRIFFAEIASIANEVLLAYHLLKKFSKNKLKKLAIYDGLISTFFASTSRQIIFSQFEWHSNEYIKNGQPFNADLAEQIYHKINVEYTKANPKEKDFELKTPLAKKSLTAILTIPHFYSGVFYVYKYSIGQVAGLLAANKILNGSKKDLDQYYTFLRSGTSLNPLKTIELLGIDLQQSNPWEEAGKIVAKWIQEYAELAKSIYKVNVKLNNPVSTTTKATTPEVQKNVAKKSPTKKITTKKVVAKKPVAKKTIQTTAAKSVKKVAKKK